MTSDRPASDRGRRVDPAGLAVGVLLPLALLAAAAVWLGTNWAALPAELPDHWGPRGEPDSWASKSEAVAVPAVVLGVTLLPMTALAAFARVDLFLRRMLLAIGWPIVAMVGTLLAGPLLEAARGNAEASVSSWTAALGAAAGLAVGVAGALMLRDGRRRVPAAARPAATLPRAALEELAYEIRFPRWWSLGLVVLLGGTVAVIGVFEPGMGVALGLAMLPVAMVVWPFRVEAGPDGLRVRQSGLTVIRVPAGGIAGVEPGELDPWRHGGAGYRLTGGEGVLVAAARGPGVTVTTGSGRTIRLAVPGEAGSAVPGSAVPGEAVPGEAASGAVSREAVRVAGVLNSAADAAH